MIQKVLIILKFFKNCSRLSLPVGLAWVVSLNGCGYSFQGSKNPALIRDGIRRIYVAPIDNSTFKPGMENTVYNSLIRSLSVHRRVELVTRPEDADAILSGIVYGASYQGSAGTQVTGLKPLPLGSSLVNQDGYVVASEYTATLTCYFSLVRRGKPRPGEKGGFLWDIFLSRSKPFPAANQLDVPGMTSALINESEFERALLDIARSMMDDAHDAMLARF